MLHLRIRMLERPPAGVFCRVEGFVATQRIFVSGRVQNVSFRDWTIRTAKSFGLTGWVRNLTDGRVEILANGEEEAIGQLVDACREGPPLARVENVSAVPDTDKPGKGFTKRFTA
jgi:acylphosphatase